MTAVAPVGAEAAAALAAIHATAFDRPWDADAFAGFIAQPGVLALAEGEGGFILVRRVLDEAEVLTLAVRPSARRRGLGRRLTEAAAGRMAAAGAVELRLEAAADNAAARALYATCGFRETGLRRGYYARDAGAARGDAVLMARRLNTGAG